MKALWAVCGLALQLGCSGSAPPPAHAAASSASRADPQPRTSSRFGYSWLPPTEWAFVDEAQPASGVSETLTVRNQDGRLLSMTVTDVVEVVPGKHPGDDPASDKKLESFGTELLQKLGAKNLRTERTQLLGQDAVQVQGELGKSRIWVRQFYRGNRWFQFRCTDSIELTEWRCGPAISGLKIRDLPEPSADADTPQVRHLRDARFGIQFDAPDDTWLSVGPRTGGGGAQVVWIWNKQGRQIDIQVMDLSSMERAPSQAMFAKGMAHGGGGNTVQVLDEVSFAGHTWSHAAIVSPKLGMQDLFVLVSNKTCYALLVTQATRDEGLIDSAKKGFKLNAK